MHSATQPEPDHDEFLRHFVAAEPKLCAYVHALVFHRADAEDILQEVAVVLWAKYPEFASGTNFTAWACRVAYHEILHYRRRHQRSRLEFNDDLLRRMADEVEPILAEQDAREHALAACLEKLPDAERALIRQRHWQGVTGRSLAQLLGRSESSVSRALGRVYTRLLACIRQSLDAQGVVS